MPPITGSQVSEIEVELVSVMGIDPGASGGIAHLVEVSTVKGSAWEMDNAVPMPKTERDVVDIIQSGVVHFAVIEQVGGYTGEGQPGSAMFKFGYGAGIIKGAVLAAKIPFEMATPQKWQKALGIVGRKKTESKTQWKNRLKQKAQELFPDVKVTLATADALLIAEYARRVWLARERPNTSHTGA